MAEFALKAGAEVYGSVRWRSKMENIDAVRSQHGPKRIALYGTGEVAELAYLTLKELGVEPVAILDGEGGAHFLGQSVRDAGAIPPEDYDYMVVATLDRTEEAMAALEARGIRRSRLMLLQSRAVRASPGEHGLDAPLRAQRGSATDGRLVARADMRPLRAT